VADQPERVVARFQRPGEEMAVSPRQFWTRGMVRAVCAVSLSGCALFAINYFFPPVRECVHHCSCKSNLRQIGLAIHMYADDYNDEFPPDFKALYPNYVDNPKVFKCPQGKATYKDFYPGGTIRPSSTSYAYVPGLKATTPGHVILAYDKTVTNHGGLGRNVVFADAHVEWWPEDAPVSFWEYLAEQMLAIARARAEGAAKPDLARLDEMSAAR
jgi:prepilin-type processing-associated H-X9-DG protein